ncbi:MAG: thiopurine S-methyltransferase [Myxococcota bacterium]
MEHDFWHARWSEGRIGFHEGVPNEHLVTHAARLAGAKRLLVPLCGKAEDLAWLASPEGGAHEVVGVELVERAVQDFFAEHAHTPAVTREGPLTRYQSGAVTVFAGDFFALTPAQLGPVDGFYDRAALIALPAPMRPRYVQHLRALLPKGAPGLLVSVEYPQAQLEGPPFSVPEDEVGSHWTGAKRLGSVPARGGRLEKLPATEKCFFVET